MATAKEICESVPRFRLDSPISDIHICDIASHITDWQELAPYLDLSEVEEKDIADCYPNRPNLQRREALRKWKEINGIRASYRRLICVLCSQSRANTAQTLKELLTHNKDKGDELDNFHEYLCDCYINLHHPSCLQWPFFSNQSYAELDLYDAPLTESVGEIIKPLHLKAIFSAGKQNVTRKVIFIEGVAGSGKSTLCWYVCKEWAAGRIFKDIKLLIHVTLSNTAIHSATKLADLVPHPSEEMRDAVAKSIADARGKGTCFLLDGCDEAPLLFRGSTFLSQFIAGTVGRSMIPHANILLTSRPGVPSDLLKCITGKTIIKGFKSLDRFIETTVSDNSEKRAQIFEALEMKPELYSLCHLPLHAVILIHLFDFLKDNLPTTRTGLFHPLVCNFLIRHIQTRTKHHLDSIFDLSTDLPSDVYLSFNSVSKLAYQSLISGNIVVTQKMLRTAGIKPILDNTFGFLQSYQRITMFGPSNLYCFSHLSLQEFLAAFHITQLGECDQVAAFELVYKQNPLSPILTFYAGLTRLASDNICKLLFHVLNKPFDLLNVAQELQRTFNLAHDRRRQLLALMNCIYEAQKEALLNSVVLTPRGSKDRILALSPNTVKSSHIEFPLSFMLLYPTDCLAVGYFVRLACRQEQISDTFVLNMSHTVVRAPEIKALSQELCKPAHRRILYVNIKNVQLTNEALHCINTMFNSQSALLGLLFTGCLVDNMQLALKYIIEGLSSNPVCEYLVMNDCNVSLPLTHHLVLLLSCHRLKTLDLAGGEDLFKHPKVMPLFCAALEHRNCCITRLFLDGCGIDDHAMQLLAASLTGGCFVRILDIGWNPYTSDGLTNFLKILISRFHSTLLVVLSPNMVNAEHHALVRTFNVLRRQFTSYMYPCLLYTSPSPRDATLSRMPSSA